MRVKRCVYRVVYTSYMTITFYFDPSCPFSWITSRWLLQISSHRDVSVTWQPFCLAIKNDELVEKPGEDRHAQSHRDSLRMLRVMLTAEHDHGVELIRSYTESGMIRHILGERLDDAGIAQVIKNLELPAELLTEADDTSYDAALRHSLDEAIAVVGNDTGVPTIVFDLPDGTKQGYFGPVLNELPELNDSLAIWDGLSRLATAPGFYELKRSRPTGDPDVGSTARC